MSKLFRLLYVNLLGLFDINKIIVARKEGVKSNLENRTIIMGVGAIAIGYVFYKLMGEITFSDSIYFFSLGFIVSTLYCFITDFSLIEPIIFDNSDNEFLFSLPVTKNQIVFSKLFSIYLKNIFLVIIIMTASMISYLNGAKVNETMVLMYIVGTLFIPFVPIVVCTFIAYINDYYKVKVNKKVFNIIKFLIVGSVVLLAVWAVRNTNFSNVSDITTYLVKKINIFYPLAYLFKDMILGENALFFFLYIGLNILVIYVYNSVISNNILKICSMLHGINKNQVFVYKKTKNCHKFFGIVRKELNNLFNFKGYLFSSFGLNVVMFILIVILINMIDISNVKEIEYFSVYFNSYGPAILGMLNTLNIMTISSISLEKDNMQMFRTMPVSMSKILTAKWFTNVFISSIFVIIEGLLFIIKFKMFNYAIIFWIGLPLLFVMFMSLTGLVLDYTFVSKKEKSDNVIMRQRLITFVPTVISIIVGLLPIFLNTGLKVDFFSGAYMILIAILILIEVLYLVINKKKLLTNLFN